MSGFRPPDGPHAYDAAGRLSQVLLPGSPTRTDRRYLYDVSSNRTEIREAAEGLPPTPVETYTYDATTLDLLRLPSASDSFGGLANWPRPCADLP